MLSQHRVVGVDESGKGDFFGPLVIAAFLADDSDLAVLKASGVRDGKLISDNKIRELDCSLRKDFAHAIIVIKPESYNRRYKRLKNLNWLLAEGHAEAIDRILRGREAELVISDKFGKAELVADALARRKRTVRLEQVVRGESIPQVAGASILARARFLREMDELSEACELELPRGAAPKVDEIGRRLVRKFGEEMLQRVAKLHFKNYQRITNPTLF
jgi:ribonuclease HIII